MSAASVAVEIPLLLPEVEEVRDACVTRLVALLERRPGIDRVHVQRTGAAAEAGSDRHADEPVPAAAAAAELCLHYDPQRLTLSQVRALAQAAGAEVTDRFAHRLIAFRDVGSEDDGQRIEAGLRALPGVTAASVNLAAQVARVEYDRQGIGEEAIVQRLVELGATPESSPPREARGVPAPDGSGASTEHDATETGQGAEQPAGASWYARNRELAWSLTAGVLLAAGWLVHRGGGAGALVPARVLFLAAYVFGARDNVGHFIQDLRRGHLHFNIDLLMVVAALGAAVLGQWAEGALLLFLFSLGHALEHYALGRARNAIRALGALVPQVATVLRDGAEQVVPVAAVRPGDLVVVRPASRLPVDGTVSEGTSSVDQAPITGESMPVPKGVNDVVFAGSVNGEGALVVRVTAAVGDRTLDRVIRLVAEAQTQKAPTQQFTDRFERIFVPAVLVADVLLIVLPPLLGVWSWPVAFYRAMTLLVAASPCALALGTPAAVLTGIAQAARNGVLIKGGAYLEALGTVRALAVDKTGTITRGEPALTDVVPLGGTSEAELLGIAAGVEQRSQHPLARAVLTAAADRSIPLPAVDGVQAITGRGLRGFIDGQSVEVGRLLLFEESAADGTSNEGSVPDAVRTAVDRLERAGRTTFVVRRGAGDWLGVLGVADEPRAAARATVERLRAAGVQHVIMLTGDNERVGRAVGDAVGIADVRAGLLPEDKVTAVRELAARGPVAMVGDGVNDAPALAHATVGIAMGGAGTAAALETADVALMGDDLARLPFAIGLSRQTRRVIRQNLVVSLGVIGVLIVASVTGLIGIGPAVVIHEGSTLVVIANGLRLLTHSDRPHDGNTRSPAARP